MATYNDFVDAFLKNGRLGLGDADTFGNVMGGTDEASALAELRRRSDIPSSIPDSVIKSYYSNNDVLGPQPDKGFRGAAMDFAGPGSVLDTFAKIIASAGTYGAASGALAASNSTGATDSLGGKNTAQAASLANMAYGNASSDGSLGSTPDANTATSEYGLTNTSPSENYWNNTFAANNTGTMTDASPAGAPADAGGKSMFDDFTGQWTDSPGYSAWDYSSPAGWSTNPSTADLGGNIDPNTGFVMDGSSGSGLAGLLTKYGPMALKFIKDNPGLLRTVGSAGAAGLGALGANASADAYRDVANKYLSLGAPSRERYEASFAPGFSMSKDPGYQDALDATTKATLHGLSVGGNPAGSPNAWAQTLSDVNSKFAFPALQNYRSTNANAGGIASLQTAAPGADTSAVNAGKGVYDALGAGAADIFSPPRRLSDILAEIKRAGL